MLSLKSWLDQVCIFLILASWTCVNYTVDKKGNYETLDFSGINIVFNFLIHCPFTKNNTLHFTIYWTLNYKNSDKAKQKELEV